MGERLTENDLRMASRLKPQATGLVEESDEWWLGQIAVPKSSTSASRTGATPTYRRGWTFKIDDHMDFEPRKFIADDGSDAVAVVLRGETDDFFAGWFSATREREVRQIVAQLNHELDEERFRCRTEDAVTLETGSEFAPDDPFGHESVTVTRDGRVSYVRRKRGNTSRRVGQVPAPFAVAVHDAIAISPFPASVQERFAPNSISRLSSTGSRRGQVSLDIDAAVSAPYREAVQPLRELIVALRNDDVFSLETMGFEGALLPY